MRTLLILMKGAPVPQTERMTKLIELSKSMSLAFDLTRFRLQARRPRPPRALEEHQLRVLHQMALRVSAHKKAYPVRNQSEELCKKTEILLLNLLRNAKNDVADKNTVGTIVKSSPGSASGNKRRKTLTKLVR